MKKNLFLLIIVISLIPVSTWGQSIYYSQTSGDPNVLANWNTNRLGGGSSPSNFTANNQYFIIQNGHTLTTTATGWSFSGSSGSKIVIESGGVLQSDYAITWSSGGTFQVENGGTYIHNNSSSTSGSGGIFSGTESFASNSTVEIKSWVNIGTSLTSGVMLPFGNIIINWSTNIGNWQWGLSGSVNLCASNFTLTSTGSGTLIFGASGGPSITIGGDINLVGGTLNMSNGSGATIINLSKNFNLTGATLTESSSGSGTLHFNGSSAQSFTKSSGTISNTINFTINNSYGLVLNNNLDINGTGTLTFSSGNIDLNGNSITIGTGKGITQVGNLIWTSGFITGNGSLKRWIQDSKTITVGETAGLFPFGSSQYNRNLWIGCITTSSGGGTISVQHSNQTGFTDISSFIDGGITVDRRHNMNWTITTADGLSGGSNFSLRIQGSGIPGVTSFNDLRLIRSSDAVGTSSNGSGTNLDPQVNRGGLSSITLANTFYFGANSQVNPLPVELTSFTVSSIEGGILLNWSTATEVNNYGFNVERRTNSEEWAKIAFVNGNGNSNSPKNYTFRDNAAPAGKVQYRLKQIDFDGKFEYSDIVEVNVEVPSKLTLYQNIPNPFNPTTEIKFSLPQTRNVELSIYNMLGEKIQTLVSGVMNAGEHKVFFNASNLSSGVYLYKLTTENSTTVKKMILMK